MFWRKEQMNHKSYDVTEIIHNNMVEVWQPTSHDFLFGNPICGEMVVGNINIFPAYDFVLYAALTPISGENLPI